MLFRAQCCVFFLFFMWHFKFVHRQLLVSAEMKQVMNLAANVPRQPFHVAALTFDDAIKDATVTKRWKTSNFLKLFFFFSCFNCSARCRMAVAAE